MGPLLGALAGGGDRVRRTALKRPNGRGYPQVLARAELLRPYLLLFVADVCISLLEDRFYRPGMSPPKARDLLPSLAEVGDVDSYALRMLLSPTRTSW